MISVIILAFTLLLFLFFANINSFFSHKYFLIGNYLKSLVKYCFVYFECKDENPTHNNCKWDNLNWRGYRFESPINVSMSLSICSPMHLSISLA